MLCPFKLLIISILFVVSVLGCTTKTCASRRDVARSGVTVDPLMNPPNKERQVLANITNTVHPIPSPPPPFSEHTNKPLEVRQKIHEEGPKLTPRKTRIPKPPVYFSHALPSGLRQIFIKGQQSPPEPRKESVEMISGLNGNKSGVPSRDSNLNNPEPLLINSRRRRKGLLLCPPETFITLKPFEEGSFSMTSLAKHIETGKLVIRKDVLAKNMNEFVIQNKMSAVSPRIYCVDINSPDHYYNWQRTLPKSLQKEGWYGLPAEYMRISVYMEYYSCGDLSKLVASPDINSLKSCILQAHAAVNFVHSGKYLHLDIKPDNFVLDHAKRVRLIDFGLSMRRKKGLRIRKFRGTMFYMSPEMFNGGVLDITSDYYSFGMMMFALFEAPSDLLAKGMSFKATPTELRAVIRGLISSKRAERTLAWKQLPKTLTR